MGLIPGPSSIPQPPPRLSISIRGMRVDSGGKTQMRKTTQTHLLILHSSDSNRKLLWYHNFVKYLVIPLTVVAVYHHKGLAGLYRYWGERIYVSVFSTNCEDTGTWTATYRLPCRNTIIWTNASFPPLLKNTVLWSAHLEQFSSPPLSPCLVSRVAPLCYIITTHQPGK